MENINNSDRNPAQTSEPALETITGSLWCSPDHAVVFLHNNHSGCALSKEIPLSVCIDSKWHPTVLDHIQYPDGQYGWILAGTSIRDTGMNGLTACASSNLWAQRSDGKIYSVTKYGYKLSSEPAADCYFYRYSEMSETEAARIHLSYLEEMLRKERVSPLEYRQRLERILRDVEADGESWKLIRQAMDNYDAESGYAYHDGDELIDEYIAKMEELADMAIKKKQQHPVHGQAVFCQNSRRPTHNDFFARHPSPIPAPHNPRYSGK